jgi:hypothetical protein
MIKRDCDGAMVVTCVICGGDTTFLSSQGLSLETLFGKFKVHFHPSCWRKDTEAQATKALMDLVAKNDPANPASQVVEKEDKQYPIK